MRPKIVILTLVVAIGLLALVAVLSGVMGRHGHHDDPIPESGPGQPESPVASRVQPSLVDTNAMAIAEQLREAELAKQLDEVRELQAEGWASPTTTSLLLSKVTHPEPEVRKGAVEALVQLHATDAVPGLEQALGHLENPRDKVAVMDAIEYLKLPTESPRPAAATDGSGSGKDTLMPVKPKRESGASNPRPQSGARKSRQRDATAPAAPATQPGSPAPGTPVPQ
jgi:hypothetical protein